MTSFYRYGNAPILGGAAAMLAPASRSALVIAALVAAGAPERHPVLLAS